MRVSRGTLLRFASAAGVAAARGTASATDQPIRLLTTAYESTAAPVFADRMGFFEKAGLRVDVKFLTTGAGTIAAVLSGAADIGVSTPLSLAAAHERSLPLVAIAPGALYRRQTPAQLLIVAKNSPFKTGRDIAGKTVAVVDLHATAQLAIEAWVDRAGGDASSVRFVEMPVSAMSAALESGHIDAAFSIEPALETALRTARVLADPQAVIAPEFLLQIYVATTTLARRQPAGLRRLAAALIAAGRWANDHPNESLDLVLQIAKIDPSVAQHIVRSRYGERLTPGYLQPVIDLAARYGFLTTSFNAADLIWRG